MPQPRSRVAFRFERRPRLLDLEPQRRGHRTFRFEGMLRAGARRRTLLRVHLPLEARARRGCFSFGCGDASEVEDQVCQRRLRAWMREGVFEGGEADVERRP